MRLKRMEKEMFEVLVAEFNEVNDRVTKLRAFILDEEKISLVFAMTSGSEPDAHVISFVLPAIKLGSASRSDGETGIVQDHSFQALLNTVTTGGLPATTMLVQDTSVV